MGSITESLFFGCCAFAASSEVNRSLRSQLIFHEFGRGRPSHLFKLDFQDLMLNSYNAQALLEIMSCSATESPFPSSFLGCPIYINDKSSWGERETPSSCVASSGAVSMGASQPTQWQHRMNMARLGRSVKQHHRCRRSRTAWLGLGCVLRIGAGHGEVCAGTTSTYPFCQRGCGRKAMRLGQALFDVFPLEFRL